MPWSTWRMPRSRARRTTAADLRPEMMATVDAGAAAALLDAVAVAHVERLELLAAFGP